MAQCLRTDQERESQMLPLLERWQEKNLTGAIIFEKNVTGTMIFESTNQL